MTLTCNVCVHHCKLSEGQTGFCHNRMNQNGQNISGGYGRFTAIALDPIEKKPLSRYMPGSKVLSVGGFGCNLRCPFCQNHEISMAALHQVRTEYVPVDRLVDEAESLRPYGNIGVAFTYNEPLINYEYILECAQMLHTKNMKCVLVTNGTIEAGILDLLLPHIDAMNIDVKGFTQDVYDRLKGSLETVKHTVEKAYTQCHVELTTLVVPTLNTDIGDFEKEVQWIASLDPKIPLHITRCFPQYKMKDIEPTDLSVLYEMKRIAKKYLKDVLLGNC